ncbi:UpxY family transcription antiterminator [Prevotellamassilia timonensis]|uniref:UpxY family transcription antiterminator n=1 Tax=Prevotellamassilia timonensis TaxID=1852370 RepID=UPI0023F173D7|nr:UpxY family transcription antiterminator [Prevotellamassilia timonensis]MDD7439273.1 UpxY family transcription antiterminator [Prevotellamassilia timonensis]
MEDTTNQPSAADASLYNGQLTDTSLPCPSAGLTFCTPSISENVGNGVSVRSVPTENEQWFVLRVSYGRILKAKTFVEAKGLEYYIPLRYKEIKKQCKKRIIIEPLLPSFIFIHTTEEQIEALLHDNKIVANGSRPLLSYYFDHTIHRQDNPDRNPPLTIRDEAMSNFIRLTSIKSPHIIPITSDNIQFKLGDMVIVTEGEFKGIRGRVARIAGQQRVVIEIFEEFFVATAYIPKNAMKLHIQHKIPTKSMTE